MRYLCEVGWFVGAHDAVYHTRGRRAVQEALLPVYLHTSMPPLLAGWRAGGLEDHSAWGGVWLRTELAASRTYEGGQAEDHGPCAV